MANRVSAPNNAFELETKEKEKPKIDRTGAIS